MFLSSVKNVTKGKYLVAITGTYSYWEHLFSSFKDAKACMKELNPGEKAKMYKVTFEEIK